MSARDDILGRLRTALSRTDLRFPPPEAPSLTDHMAVTHADGDRWQLAERFQKELAALHGSAEVVETPTEARMAVIARLSSWVEDDQAERRTKNPELPEDREVLCWEPELLPVDGLEPALRDLGFRLVVPEDLQRPEEKERIRLVRAGVTGVSAAFASTGSMLMAAGPGRSRAASLTALRHIALVPLSRLYPSAEEWMADCRSDGSLARILRSSANVTLITGPSKSADIGGNLTLGVHGPKEVHAILFDDIEALIQDR